MLSAHTLAAPFRNLGFEEAITNTVQFTFPSQTLQGFGPASGLIPGWQAYLGTNLLTTIAYNRFADQDGFVSLFDEMRRPSGFPFEGRYALHLVGTINNITPLSLVQTGDIPADAGLLIATETGAGGFEAFINGTRLDRFFLVGALAYDVSEYAGQTVELKFESVNASVFTFVPGVALDDIRFAPIPEPSTWVLLGLGILALPWRRARRFLKN